MHLVSYKLRGTSAQSTYCTSTRTKWLKCGARLLRLEEIVLKHSDPAIIAGAPPAHRPWQNAALTTFIPPTTEGLPSKIEAEILKKVSFNENWFVCLF